MVSFEKDGPEALIDFHTRYRYLLFTYNQSMLRRLERLVARTDLFLRGNDKVLLGYVLQVLFEMASI